MHFPLWLLLLLSIVIATTTTAFSAEVDSITPPPQPLADSRDTLNKLINERLKEGVDMANLRQENGGLFLAPVQCDENILYTELRRAIFQSLTASLGFKGYSLDKQLRELLSDRIFRIPLEDSIYRDISYFEGMSLNLKELSAQANISGQTIGLDKIGHFFSEGYRYFSMVREDHKTLLEAAAWGEEKEEGLYGYATTGIFSYADLVANFNGYRFWNRMLKTRRDPLQNVVQYFFSKPYVKCELQVIESLSKWQVIRRWRIKKNFDIDDFIDGAWDERNNCNNYANPEIEEKVRTRIKEQDPDFTCPAREAFCLQAVEKYKDFAPHLLHPGCLGIRESCRKQ